MLFFLKKKHHNLNGADDIVFFNDQFKNSMFNGSIFIKPLLKIHPRPDLCYILCAVVLVWYFRLAQHIIKPWEKDNEIIGYRLHFESFLCTETTRVKTEEWL